MNTRLFFLLFMLAQLTLVATGVVAADSRGIALQAVNKNPVPGLNHGTYRALIIGNNDYRDQQGLWKPLKTALSDAHAVKNILQSSYGFTDVSVVENATRRDVLKAFESLSQKVLPNDNVLVYYAGHGFMENESSKGYWIPVDAEGTDNTTFLRNSTIRDEIAGIADRAKHTLLISDSCFSGSLLRRDTRGITEVTGTEQYYTKVSNKKSVQILAAGGEEFVDDNYQSSGHSPFTYFLLNELQNNDRPMLTLSELSTNVEKAVANNVDQVPASGVLHGAGDELGEFIFVKVNLVVDGIDASKVKVQVNVTQGDKPGDKPSSDNSTDSKPAPTPKNNNQPHTIIPVPTL